MLTETAAGSLGLTSNSTHKALSIVLDIAFVKDFVILARLTIFSDLRSTLPSLLTENTRQLYFQNPLNRQEVIRKYWKVVQVCLETHY